MLHCVVWQTWTNISEVLTASMNRVMSLTLIMEAVSTSEMSVNTYQSSWCIIPEDSHQIHHCANLKSQLHVYNVQNV
jgi:two-component sensor histidine kinase